MPSHIIQGKTYAGLVQPHFAHDVIEKLHDGHATKRVILHQLAEHSGLKEGSEKQRKIFMSTSFLTDTEYVKVHDKNQEHWSQVVRK